MKQCKKCNLIKKLIDFYSDKQKIDGKTTYCKSCINEKQAKERKNPAYIYNFNEYQKEWQRSYRKTDKYKIWRDKALLVQSKKAQKLKSQIVDNYGGKCACCGISELCFLSIDHINNDGYKTRERNDGTKRKNRVSGYLFYEKIIKENFPRDLQILCFNCNTAKQHNKGICPHKNQ
jgi:hypothetical protein